MSYILFMSLCWALTHFKPQNLQPSDVLRSKKYLLHDSIVTLSIFICVWNQMSKLVLCFQNLFHTFSHSYRHLSPCTIVIMQTIISQSNELILDCLIDWFVLYVPPGGAMTPFITNSQRVSGKQAA